MSYAQKLCDEANNRLWQTRRDCEWILDASGNMHLTQSREWTEAHTQELERKAEADRRQHMHRAKYPITGGGN